MNMYFLGVNLLVRCQLMYSDQILAKSQWTRDIGLTLHGNVGKKHHRQTQDTTLWQQDTLVNVVHATFAKPFHEIIMPFFGYFQHYIREG